MTHELNYLFCIVSNFGFIVVLSQSGMSKAIIKKQLPSNDPTTGDYSEAGSTQLRILRVRVFVIVHKWRRATGMGPASCAPISSHCATSFGRLALLAIFEILWSID